MLKALILDVLKCFIITACVEVIGGFALGVRSKKSLINVLIVNIMTNPLLVSITLYFNIRGSTFERNVVPFLLESVVVLIEGFVYAKYGVRTKRLNPYVLSLILNFVSYAIGVIIKI